MILLPTILLVNVLTGLLALAFLLIGFALLYRAYRQYRRLRRVAPPPLAGPVSPASLSPNQDAPVLQKIDPYGARAAWAAPAVWVPLAIGTGLILFTFGGRQIVQLFYRAGEDEPRELHSPEVREITRPDGTKLHVEIFGPATAPTLVLTHGWSTSNTEWYYAKRHLAGPFRLIIWDLPGLGQTTQPRNRDFRLEKMAADLNAVIGLAGGAPVVLVGHSIGGMINLTFCRLFPDQLGHSVRGIVEVDTSYTNPVTTTQNAGLAEALQKPVGEPLLHAMVWFSPLFRLMNWLSYQNGSSYIANAASAFAGSETRGQVDLISRYGYESTPSVVARGTLAMLHWDASPVLPNVNVPVLMIVGKQDTTTLPSASEHMQQTMPQGRLEEVSPSAHYGLLEQNGRYDELLSQFASACLKSGVAPTPATSPSL